VSEADIQVAATTVRMASEAVKRGAITNHASHAAIEYLDAYAHDLRAEGGQLSAVSGQLKSG
jgi:hypothetical protein